MASFYKGLARFLCAWLNLHQLVFGPTAETAAALAHYDSERNSMLEPPDSSEQREIGRKPFQALSAIRRGRIYPVEGDRASEDFRTSSLWFPVIRTTTFRTKILVSTSVLAQLILTGAIIASTV